MVVEALVSARTPVLLAVAAFLLAGYIVFFQLDRPRQTEIEQRHGFLVPSLVRERVTAIRVRSGDAETVLVREGEGFDETWTLGAPDGAPADIDKVENYLREWQFAMPTRTMESPTDEDVKAFGLDGPSASAQFEMGSGEITVFLGSGKPVDAGGYVRVGEGDHAVVVPESVVELFDVDPERFRDELDGGVPTLDQLIESDTDASADDPSETQDAASAAP